MAHSRTGQSPLARGGEIGERAFQGRLPGAALGLLVLSLWILAHPYRGMVHDALHYTALGLYELGTPAFETDLLFVRPPRSYSLFPPIQTWLIGALGPSSAHLALSVFGQLFWLAAVSALAVSTLGRGLAAGLAVAAVCVLTSTYGYNGSISYGEVIATPRLFAEAMVLLAFALSLRGTHAAAFTVAALAMAVHPLMAFPGLLILVLLRFGLNWRTAAILAGATALGLGLAVTGGEPLVRTGVIDLIGRLAALEGLRDVSLTTNGVLLEDYVDAIRAAGIRRINVSLDTLDPEKYARITRRNRFRKVWNGIMAAHRAGFDPIKINVVAMAGINDDELTRLAQLSYDYPFHVRFIEYMPIGDVGSDHGRQIYGDDILNRLGKMGAVTPVARQTLDGPAQRYRLAGARGEIGIIGAVSHHFCGQCNRLRLTANGRLRTCLLSDEDIDVRGPLRQGCTDRDLEEIFIEAARRKQDRHHLSESQPKEIRGRMSAIGG